MSSTVIGCIGDSIAPLGTTILPITIVHKPRSKAVMVTFMVVNLSSAYNVILSWLLLIRLRVIVSTYHRVMKFSTRAGIEEVRSDSREYRQCYLAVVILTKKLKSDHSTLKKAKLSSPPFDRPLIDPCEASETRNHVELFYMFLLHMKMRMERWCARLATKAAVVGKLPVGEGSHLWASRLQGWTLTAKPFARTVAAAYGHNTRGGAAYGHRTHP
ncbi:hypothetical protein B296_00027753 [Ensete ventricosum]|uniref:Uncharacterized protein n=1 Tax=Ensete ventricosum TaxID=4639 RepID=A0A427ALT5_ENSVE|nr:hypothetical protein B296_00027753 [Ensete ventricosum]